MAWAGGTFSRTISGGWATDKATTPLITAARHDVNDDDLATGINACLNKDGSNAATGDLDLGSNKLTSVADPTNDQDAVTKASLSSLADYIGGGQIADNAIDSEHYTDGSIDADHLATDSVTAVKIAAGAVDTSELATDAVTAVKIAAGAVDTSELATDAVTNVKMASNAVDTAELVNSAVTTAKIADNAVGAAKISIEHGNSLKIVDVGATEQDILGYETAFGSGVLVLQNPNTSADGKITMACEATTVLTLESDEIISKVNHRFDGKLDLQGGEIDFSARVQLVSADAVVTSSDEADKKFRVTINSTDYYILLADV